MNLFQILFQWKNDCLRKQICNQACIARASSRANNNDKSRISSLSEKKQTCRLWSNPQKNSEAGEKIFYTAVVCLVMVKHGKEKRNRFSILEVSVLILHKSFLPLPSVTNGVVFVLENRSILRLFHQSKRRFVCSLLTTRDQK